MGQPCASRRQHAGRSGRTHLRHLQSLRASIENSSRLLPRIVGILKQANYRGWLALEYEDSEEPKVAVPRYLAELRRLTAGPPPA